MPRPKISSITDPYDYSSKKKEEKTYVQNKKPQPIDLTLSHNASSNETFVLSNEERVVVVDLTWGSSIITFEDVLEGPETDEVIIHKYNIPMTRKHLCRLHVGKWLNDEIVNFYVGLLRDRDEVLYNRSLQHPLLSMSNYQKSYFATSFFFEQLLAQGIYTYANVVRWTRDIDVFSMKYLLFPVNLNNAHWTQLTIYMESKEIHYYDSMNGDGNIYLKAAMRWLCDESLYKRGLTLNARNEWSLIQNEEHVPQQHNGFDCGMFVIMCTRAIAYDQSLATYFQSDMPRYRKMVGRHIIRGSLQDPNDDSFPYFFDLPPRQQQLLVSPEFAFESPVQDRQNGEVFCRNSHTSPSKRQRTIINTTSQSPTINLILHYNDEKDILDSDEDSEKDSNVGNDDDNLALHYYNEKGIVDSSEDSEDDSNVNKDSSSTNNTQNGFDAAFKYALIRQKDRERKRAKRAAMSEENKEAIREKDRLRKKATYDDVKKRNCTSTRGLSEEEKNAARRQRDKLLREKKKQLQINSTVVKNADDLIAKKRTQNEIKSNTYLLSLSKDKEKGAKRRKQESERVRKGRQKKHSTRVEVPAGRKADINSYTPLSPDHRHK